MYDSTKALAFIGSPAVSGTTGTSIDAVKVYLLSTHLTSSIVYAEAPRNGHQKYVRIIKLVYRGENAELLCAITCEHWPHALYIQKKSRLKLPA